MKCFGRKSTCCGQDVDIYVRGGFTLDQMRILALCRIITMDVYDAYIEEIE